MRIEPTIIDGCFIVKPEVFKDDRGYFFESFNEKTFLSATGLSIKFVQDNQSFSKKNVLRGLHLQIGIHAQSKLVRAVKGKVFDVCVDLRKESKTFGKHITVVLDDVTNNQIFIPKGCAHGFLALQENTIVSYKCDAFYHKESDTGIRFDDAELNIEWPGNPSEYIISEKDKNLPSLQQFLQQYG